MTTDSNSNSDTSNSNNVIRLAKHHWAHCTNKYCYGCHLCHGGLASCTVCGGFEGGLTTDCAGRMMTAEEHDSVYAGDLDYTRKDGWVAQASKYSPNSV